MAERNVFGEPLVPCSFEPITGWFRDGCCKADQHDVGSHLVCAVLTEEFLSYSKSQGNDLTTPQPARGFPGLVPNDQWCLCATRWQQAYVAGVAPALILESTNSLVLNLIPMDVLKRFDHRFAGGN